MRDLLPRVTTELRNSVGARDHVAVIIPTMIPRVRVCPTVTLERRNDRTTIANGCKFNYDSIPRNGKEEALIAGAMRERRAH
jgi:hypothetical protein